MSATLQIGLLVISVLTTIFVVRSVVKNRMYIRYSLIWILWGAVIIFMSVFPQAMYSLTSLMGIEKPVNTVFLIMIFLLYVMSFHLYSVLSKQKEEIQSLNYEIALLKKQLNDKRDQ